MLKVKEWNASLINNSWILLFSSDLFSSFAFHFFFHCIFYNLSVSTDEWVSLFNNVFLISSNIYFTSLPVCLYPINVKTAEPIWPRFCVNPHWPKGSFMENQNFKKIASVKISFSLNLENPRHFFVNFLLFYNVYKEMLRTRIEHMGAKRPNSSVG